MQRLAASAALLVLAVTGSTASAHVPGLSSTSTVTARASSDCRRRAVGLADGTVHVTDDGGGSWRVVYTPARITPFHRRFESVGSARQVDPTEAFAGAIAAGLLYTNLRDLWYFGDGETGLDFFDASDDGGALDPSEQNIDFPEAGMWYLKDDPGVVRLARGRRAFRLLSRTRAGTLPFAVEQVADASDAMSAITALWLDGDVVHVSTVGQGCLRVDAFGARVEPCRDAPPSPTLDCPTATANVTQLSGRALGLVLAAAERRFGEARRQTAEAPKAAARAAFVPRLAVVGGVAVLDRTAFMAAAFLDDPTPFSNLATPTGFGFGSAGNTLADGDNVTFRKDSTLALPYVAVVLAWDLAGPEVPLPSLDGLDESDALRNEVASLWLERARLASGSAIADPYADALRALRVEELDATLAALTGEFEEQ